MQHGLLSAEEVVKRPGLLQLARPDKTDQKLLLQLLKMRSKDEDSALMVKGPSVFFSPPPKEKITEGHYMRKWGLVPLRVDLDRLWRDDPSLRVHGTELTPWRPLGNTPMAKRRRDLTPEEVDAFRRTPPRELWQHYNDTRYYAADVPHAALITRDGRIDPKYLRVIGKQKLEKTADKNNPGRITKMLKVPKPDLEGFAPLAYVKGTAKKSYLVGIQDGKSWRCTCPNWTYRGSKSGEPCKHIRAVQERKEKKGHAKTAATRYDKEVARGNISYTDIANRMPAEYGFFPDEDVDRFDVHHAMAEPSKAPNLKRLRRMRNLSVRPTAKDVTQRYGFEVRLPRKRKGQDGAWMSKSMGPNPVIRVPVGGIDTRTTLDHEVAEALESKHQGGTRLLASHNGPGPLVAERHGLVGDPEAFEEYKEMRTGRGANPDDKLLWRKMKQMGATPDRPMPVGGKAHRSLNRWLDRNADMLSSDARERAMDEAESHARRFVRDGTPLPAASYVPANLRATLLDHAKDPDSRDFIFPWHPRHDERKPLNDWVEALPRAAPKVDARVLPFSPAEVAAALTNRSKATGSQLRTLLRAVRAGAL
jgi:hypothetical protein